MIKQTKSIKIAIAGASGKMGRVLIDTVLNADNTELVAALDQIHSPMVGSDAGQFMGITTGVKISYDNLEALEAAKPDFLIDFTRPEATMKFLPICQDLGIKMIIGTTGLSPEQYKELKQASKSLAMVFAPNMSIGVNATFKILELAAKILNYGYDIEIIEAHHKHKVDAPSGTALRMGEIIANQLDNNLEDIAVFAREGHTGPRENGTIGFSTVRGGDIVGDHTVLFAGSGERIEISHKSSSRQSYAQGAIRAAWFLEKKKNGIFDMQDVLNLR
jgi:4-hydroxy-tetrahydrodipicolinate reductase